MKNIKNILLSDLYKLHVTCDQGLDHGNGLMVWMHPPVHRILGWITNISSFSLSRSVWRLNQIVGIDSNRIYVKGTSSITDQTTLDRLPTLINAVLLNKNGEKLASIVDLVFNYNTGEILYYLVSRTNHKLPGTSRWSLKINNISDQQPGMVLSNLNSLDDLPLVKASIREEFMKKSKDWRDQIKFIRDKASNKLDGWLEDSPWEEFDRTDFIKYDNENNWVDNFEENPNDDKVITYSELKYSNARAKSKKSDNDPWI